MLGRQPWNSAISTFGMLHLAAACPDLRHVACMSLSCSLRCALSFDRSLLFSCSLCLVFTFLPFFQTVLAGQSTTLSVLFLAREEGAATGTLVVETSLGGFVLQVLSFFCFCFTYTPSAFTAVRQQSTQALADCQ